MTHQRRVNKALLVMAMAVPFLVACSARPSVKAEVPTGHRTTVAAYTEAFNAHDVEAMRAMMDPDIEWWSITGEGAELVSTGRENLAEELKHYFDGPNAVTSELTGEAVAGPYFSSKETVRWADKDGNEKSQASLVVYELTAVSQIRRVWYYPEVAAD